MKDATGEVEKISTLTDALWAGLRTDMPDTREGEKLISLPAAFDTETGVFRVGRLVASGCKGGEWGHSGDRDGTP